MIVTVAGVQEIRSRAAGDATSLFSRMTAAFALGQIAGPVMSSLLLYLPALRGNGLNVALPTLVLSAAWLWLQARGSR